MAKWICDVIFFVWTAKRMCISLQFLRSFMFDMFSLQAIMLF